MAEQNNSSFNVRGNRVSVLGAGRSGLGVAKLLLKRGAEVFLSDSDYSDEKKAACSRIDYPEFAFELGSHSDKVLKSCHYLVVSPGIPLDIPVIREAAKKNIPVAGELELTSRFINNPVIAVTGTNGKSTTTSMIENIFIAAGKPAVAAGNIGIAFSDIIDGLKPDDTVILEVSSYQLETIKTFHPRIAVILNITPDHLTRHKTMDEYLRCKLRITENQEENDHIIVNKNDKILKSIKNYGKGDLSLFDNKGGVDYGTGIRNKKIVRFEGGEETVIIPVEEIPVPGEHNLDNALAAATASMFSGIAPENIKRGLTAYKGLEHRLEHSGIVSGVTFINDSKATNVDSLIVALLSFSKPVILIAGGRDKQSDLNIVNQLVKDNVKSAVLIGEAADRMKEAWKDILGNIEIADGLEKAVNLAFRSAERGDTVLFSPACASFDMFNNFEARGNLFKEIVRNLQKNSR